MTELKYTKTVHPDGSVTDGSAGAMSGYTITDAVRIDNTVVTAKTRPFLEIGGSLEFSERARMYVCK